MGPKIHDSAVNIRILSPYHLINRYVVVRCPLDGQNAVDNGIVKIGHLPYLTSEYWYC